jgi:hypothetical protein
MAGVLVNQGETISLEALVNKTAPQTLVLKLFKSNTTPAEADTEGSYTEATFTGYGSISLTGANWVTTAGAPSDVTYPEQTFTSSANQSPELVYGYILVQTTSGKLVAAERFSNGPYTMQNNGDAIKVTPKITQE